MKFIPGQSGNPGGRPKGEVHVRELARARTADAVQTLVDVMTSKSSPASARVLAASALLDRGYGRPSQQLDLEGRLFRPCDVSANPLTGEEWIAKYGPLGSPGRS
jgi:Family of unknown function (DUF5681)